MPMPWHGARIFFLLTVVAIGGVQVHAADTPTDQELVARELPAVVSISIMRGPSPIVGTTAASTAAAAQPSGGSTAPRGRRFLGSGFIIDPSGIIVTNRHVIEGATDILVTLQDNTLLHATLLAQADQIDVALIKVLPDSPLPAIQFGDSDAVHVADHVLAIGNPLGLGGSVTRGIISALNRDIRDTPFDDYIQTDAAINHGNSGGPLFNERGEVIGMNTAIFSPEATSGSIGLGFAIPSNDVKYVADALRRPGGMRIGTLDFRIQQVTPEIADALNMSKAEGVIVGGTTEGGGASKCGIMAGDTILRYGNTAGEGCSGAGARHCTDNTRHSRQHAHLAQRRATRRHGGCQEVPHAAAAGAALPAPAAAGPGWRLTRVDDATRHGVVVTQIAEDGAAADAGLSAGDVVVQVQQEKVADPEDITRLIMLARQQQRRYVAVLVQRNTEGLRWLAMSLE